MKTVIINENQKGFLFKNGKYIKMLDAGKYYLFGGRTVATVYTENPIILSDCSIETLLKDKRVSDNAKLNGAEVIVTACPLCKYNLEKNGSDLPVVYITELLAEAFGIKE